MTEDLISKMRGIIDLYDWRHEANEEIRFWRERFLAGATLPKEPVKAAQIWATFLYTPIGEIPNKMNPEEYLGKIIESFHEN